MHSENHRHGLTHVRWAFQMSVILGHTIPIGRSTHMYVSRHEEIPSPSTGCCWCVLREGIRDRVRRDAKQSVLEQ
jgi:hypothetical protein